MLTLQWKRIRFYFCEFIGCIIHGFVIFFTVISLQNFKSLFFYLFGTIISALSLTALIVALEDASLCHLNPAYSFAEFIHKRYINERFDVIILIIMSIFQYLDYICIALILKYSFIIDNGIIMELIEERKINGNIYRIYFLSCATSFLYTIVSLRCRRRYILSPIIIGLMGAAIGIVSESPTLRTFNPGTAVGAKILFDTQESICLAIVLEYLASFVGAVCYIILFYGKLD